MKRDYCKPHIKCIKLNASHNLLDDSEGISVGGKGDYDVKIESFNNTEDGIDWDYDW